MKILGFAGKKQSGKNTCSNFLHGFQLKANGVVDDFSILDDGRLVVDTKVLDGEEVKPAKAILDVTRQDDEYISWAGPAYFHLIRNYSYATSLKDIAMGLFGLTHEQCYGTDEQKNSLTPLLWEKMPGVITPPHFSLLANRLKKKLKVEDDTYLAEVNIILSELGLTYHNEGPMTAREFMQFLGTEICRKIYSNVWVDRTIEQIKAEQSNLAIISDVRFENEIKGIRDAGGKVIKLTRSKFTDTHSSEADIDDSLVDAVIDNKDMNIADNCQAVMETLASWGWTQKVE